MTSKEIEQRARDRKKEYNRLYEQKRREDPEYRRKQRESSRRYYQKQRERMAADPEYRAEMLERSRRYYCTGNPPGRPCKLTEEQKKKIGEQWSIGIKISKIARSIAEPRYIVQHYIQKHLRNQS